MRHRSKSTSRRWKRTLSYKKYDGSGKTGKGHKHPMYFSNAAYLNHKHFILLVFFHCSFCFLLSFELLCEFLIMIKVFLPALKQWDESFFFFSRLSYTRHSFFQARSLLKYILHLTSKLWKHVKLFIYFQAVWAALWQEQIIT